jgi:hypothetical protein
MCLFGCSTVGDERRLGTDSLGIRNAEPTPRSASNSRTPSVRRGPYLRQCQKCQKPSKHPFGTFGTPSVSVFRKLRAFLSPTQLCEKIVLRPPLYIC